MPVYEYICEECNNKFDKMRPFSQADFKIVCIKCGSTDTRRALSRVNMHTASSSSHSSSAGGCRSCTSGNCGNCNH